LKAWILILVSLLSACSTVQTVAPRLDLPDSPEFLTRWSMDGRIAVQSGEKAWQANLFWEHEPQQDRLRLSGPWSQGLVSIVLQKDLIYVNEGGGVTALSKDPDAMLREKLGFVVPLASLRYWVLGRPNPALSSRPGAAHESDEDSAFEQSGWQIQVQNTSQVDGWLLPQKLVAQGAGVKLKIVTDQWVIRE
jgi:outer membrane lipoprotein LolB